MSSFEELRRKEVELQQKQLTAQRVLAVASVANAAMAAQQARTLRAMQSEMNEAAEATAEHQREMAEQQRQMAEEQRLANFRITVLNTLPLLKEEEKAQYLTEQLLPRILESEDAKEAQLICESFSLSEILEHSGLVEFSLNYSKTNVALKEWFAIRKPLMEGDKKLRTIEAEYAEKKASLEDVGRHTFREQAYHASISAGSLVFCNFLIISLLIFMISEFSDLDGFAYFICIISIIFVTVIPFALIDLAIKSAEKPRRKRHFELQAEERVKFYIYIREQIEKLKNDLEAIRLRIESFADYKHKLREHNELWAVVVAGFVDGYLVSAEGKAFMGEQGTDKMLHTISNPWRELVAEEQAFLPPSARLPFVEHWLPLLINEDEVLAKLSGASKRIQSQLKTFLFQWARPDYDRQVIGLEEEELSELPLCEWVGDDEDDTDKAEMSPEERAATRYIKVPRNDGGLKHDGKKLPNSKKQFPISNSSSLSSLRIIEEEKAEAEERARRQNRGEAEGAQ